MPATQSQSTRVKPRNSERCARSETRQGLVAPRHATCALIVALDVINLEKGTTAPGETTRTRSKSADVALTGKMGRSDLCLRARRLMPQSWNGSRLPSPSQAAHSDRLS
jgi:hypothetical protein